MIIKEIIKKFTPKFLLSIYYFCWALLGAMVFGFPGGSSKLKIIGVTGTSGKSTTVDLITRILEENKDKVASMSTIRFKVAEKEWENKYKMSMPGRFVIQKFLRQAVKAKCKYVVMEVTSEGIKQSRHQLIDFDCAVFTNLSPEHIESHGGFENYKKEKLKLFDIAKNIHVINADDKNAKDFLNVPAIRRIVFSIKDVQDIELSENSSFFKIFDTEFKIKLLGEFNVYNALTAISVARAYDIDLEICKKALEKAKGISGRMEFILKEPFKVVVDYAHTPEQLEAVYKSLSNCSENSKFEIRNSKLVCVLGSCGGGRDKWKRPVLGEIAKKYCKEIIITNEDPYDEDPLSIMKEIESTLSYDGASPKHQMILDRKEAIKHAISIAKPGEVVIITGKGSEPWMCLANGVKIPWDDRQIARDALKAIKNN